MKKFLPFFVILFSLALFFPATSSAASCDMSVTQFGYRSVRACFGQFTSADQLNNSIISARCLLKNQSPFGCLGDTFEKKFKDIPQGIDGGVKQTGSNFWGCTEFRDMPKEVGTITIAADGNGIGCRGFYIFPPDSVSSTSEALCNNVGVKTAFGCLMAGDPKQLISQLLGWGVVVGGGVAFVMILIAGFQITTAAGDPKKVQAARELLTAAISGLLLIVFSVLILNLIGFSILKLPGFSVPL